MLLSNILLDCRHLKWIPSFFTYDLLEHNTEKALQSIAMDTIWRTTILFLEVNFRFDEMIDWMLKRLAKKKKKKKKKP